jgi:hypothetical protein
MNNVDPKYISLRLLKSGGDIESTIATLKEFTSWQQEIQFLETIKDKIYNEYLTYCSTPQDKG